MWSDFEELAQGKLCLFSNSCWVIFSKIEKLLIVLGILITTIDLVKLIGLIVLVILIRTIDLVKLIGLVVLVN